MQRAWSRKCKLYVERVLWADAPREREFRHENSPKWHADQTLLEHDGENRDSDALGNQSSMAVPPDSIFSTTV
ncbi:MAG: hypothetical protein Rhob2KO_29350 [Rhodopirellula baltica]